MKDKKNGAVLWIGLLSVFAMVACGFACPDAACAAGTTDVKIAVVMPLSGALSRNGNLTLQGVKAAINWVNDNGGIKSLGGAKLVPVVADSGSSVESAANAMMRVCRDPDITMAISPWASALTLATTEVTERLGIPEFAHPYSDVLNQRGFKWGFYTSAPATIMCGEMGVGAVMRMAKDAGYAVRTAMVVSDNSAGAAIMQDTAVKYLQNMGVKLVGQELWTMGTLTDATPIMQKVKRLNPDLVVFNPISISEKQMCLMKKKELGLKMPFMALGGADGDPSFRQMGAANLENYIFISPSFQHKLMPQEWIKRTLDQCKKEYSDEPWMGQELSEGWSQIPIMAEILQRAGTKDRETLRKTAHELDIHDVMATRAIPGQGMAFDETGRVVKKYQAEMICQWQNGVANVVYPAQLALAKPTFMEKK